LTSSNITAALSLLGALTYLPLIVIRTLHLIMPKMH